MKLRQKLAVVLASAMVVTSVPVVTMAASTNSLTKEVLKVEEDHEFTTSDASILNVKLKDATEGDKEVFYLVLENAEWNNTINGTFDGATITTQSDTVAKVEINQVTTTSAYKIPLLTTVTGGEATVAIETRSSGSTVSEGKYVFATTSDKNTATFTVGTLTSLYTSGKLAPVTITESYKGALRNGAEFTYSIENDDFRFNFSGGVVGKDSKGSYTEYTLDSEYVQYTYGFADRNEAVKAKVYDNDLATAIFTVAASNVADSQGSITFKNLPIKATTKTPDTGDLTVTISSDNLTEEKTVTLAKVAVYGTEIAMKDDKAVSIKAGEMKEVEFTLSELVDDSLVSNREIEITLDHGHFAAGTSVQPTVTKQNGKTSDTSVVKGIDFEYVNDDKTDGIETIIINTAALNGSKLDNFTIKANIVVPIDEKDAETINVIATGRALSNEEIKTEAVTVVNPFNVTAEAINVKVGLKDQVGGKVVITETDKAMLNKGEVKVQLADTVSGVKFSGTATLTVDGDLKVADLEKTTTTGAVTVDVTRQSKTASTVTISDFTVSVDRTVAEGSYDLEIVLPSVDGAENILTVEDFFVVGTPNTEDLSSTNGLRKGTATFVVGESTYVVNGTTTTMDAASYIQNPGYTMVPVRYVAEAFGVNVKDILFSSGTVTIFAGTRTIQLTNGSNIAIVNGAQVTMGTKVVIKEGRTYAPVGEVARILGISTSWDNATKTATFTNN